MSRLLARGVCDLRLQLRNGFYYAAAAATVFLTALLLFVPAGYLDWFLPLVLIGNLLINGLYFMAGLVLLEKAEMSLGAQAVTPLRPYEYLLGKVATLGLMSIVESAAIVVLVYDAPVHWPVLMAGIVLQTMLFASIGFIVVARYEAINEFLFPSVFVCIFLALPLLDLLGVWPSPMWYLHPVQGSLSLIHRGFGAARGGGLAIALIVAAAWAGFAFWSAVRGFHRFVVAGTDRR